MLINRIFQYFSVSTWRHSSLAEERLWEIVCSVLYAPYPAHRRLRISLESYVCTTDICVVCSRIDKFIGGWHNSYTSFDFVGEFCCHREIKRSICNDTFCVGGRRVGWGGEGGGLLPAKSAHKLVGKIVDISWNWIIAFGIQRVNKDFWP